MIASISYLESSEKRKRVPCIAGKFRILRSRKGLSGSRTESKSFTAKEFVEHVKIHDPYITLKDGTKMRVYRGGNSTDAVIETISIVETHDSIYTTKQTKDTQPIIPEYPDYSDYGW